MLRMPCKFLEVTRYDWQDIKIELLDNPTHLLTFLGGRGGAGELCVSILTLINVVGLPSKGNIAESFPCSVLSVLIQYAQDTVPPTDDNVS